MNLYIIGNGFDINKGLPTRYSDFANWLKENYPNEHNIISKMFDLDDLWSDFEDQMAESHEFIKEIIDNENDSYYSEEYCEEEWREDSDRSYAISDAVENQIILGKELSKLMKEWISKIMKNFNERIDTSKNIVNFNYTGYIFGENVINIHGSISNDLPLQVGHSKKIEESRYNHVSDYGHDYPSSEVIYNQLEKNIDQSKEKFRKYLENKKIDKLIFFGFSFGEQDDQYFELFNDLIKVDFYINEKEESKKELISRIKSKFKNVNFIDSKKWNEF